MSGKRTFGGKSAERRSTGRGRRSSGNGGGARPREGRRQAKPVAPAPPPVDVDIDALALGGSGVGRLPAPPVAGPADSGASTTSDAGASPHKTGEAGGGMAVFAPGALPGSRVRIRPTKMHRRYAEAQLVEVLRPSPDEVPPVCPHFSVLGPSCGGCLLQHLSPARQLYWKERQLLEALARIGRVAPDTVLPALAATRTTGFRNTMEFTFQGAGEDLRLGLFRRDDPSRVMDVPSCVLLPEGGMELVEAVRAGCRAAGLDAFDRRAGRGFLRRLILRHSVFEDRFLAQVLTSPADPGGPAARALRALGEDLLARFPRLAGYAHAERAARDAMSRSEKMRLVLGESALVEDLGGVRYRVSPDAFFQTATEGALRLYGALREMVEPASDAALLDLYCGGGGIALFLAPGCGRALGLEANAAAVADAEANAQLNGLENCRFRRADLDDAEALEAALPQDFARPDVVTLDPPREGLSAGVATWLEGARPARVGYVSCNPATLARDLGRLAPTFRLRAVRAVDLFPHTAHVECLALLEPL